MVIPTAVPTTNPPAARLTWVEAARPHLASITGANQVKKRNTVFDVAVCQVMNTPMCWSRGTGHRVRSIWLGHWQHEPRVQAALTTVLEVLQTECTNAAATTVDQAMQHDPHRVEDVLKVEADPEGKNGDDPYDSARYGVMKEVDSHSDGVLVSY